MKLKTKELENCLRIMSSKRSFVYKGERKSMYPKDTDLKFCFELIGEVINANFNLDEEYVKPFKIELKRNLLMIESLEGKESLIRYYLWELRGLPYYFNSNRDFLINNVRNAKYDPFFYQYLENSFELFLGIMEEIQCSCFKYEIDFDSICKKIRFLINKEYYYMDLLRDTPAVMPTSFVDIFSIKDWRPFIDVLCKVEPPLLNSGYVFIGKNKGHRGVIGSWINDIQSNGKIHKRYNRQEVATVLNNEIKGLNMGKDGKTIINYCALYQNEYKAKLLNIVSLLP